MGNVPSSYISFLLIMLKIQVDKDGDYSLSLLIIGNPSGMSSRVSLTCMSRSTINDAPPSCHGKQGMELAGPMSIVGNAGKNGSMSLNSGVDVERHISKNENVCDKGLHKRKISIIV